MRSAVAAVLAFATVTVIAACGGKYDGGNPDGGSCGSFDTCSQEGATCTFQTTVCQKPFTGTCTCSNGQWACPDYGGNCPVEGCPMDTYPGTSCSTQGLQCQSMIMGCGTNQPVMCTCDGAVFNCPIPDCPVQLCPPPDQIVPNTGCTVPGNEVCPGPNGSECTCLGNWQCSTPILDGGVVDASWGMD